MKKSEIKKEIQNIRAFIKKGRVEEDIPYYVGWRARGDSIDLDLKHLEEKI